MPASSSPSDGKARLEVESGDPIQCSFNPSELKLSKSVEWKPSRAKGKNTPKLRFQSGKSGTLALTLFLDTTEAGEPVTDITNKLMNLMKVDPDLSSSDRRSNRARPPWVQFRWGQFASFKSVLTKLDLTFTHFASDGTPLRAKAGVMLTQYEDSEAFARQNPTSGTPLPHRIHKVQPGETLDRVAAAHFGDSNHWRLIAQANNVLNPFLVPAGTILAIPDRQVVRRG